MRLLLNQSRWSWITMSVMTLTVFLGTPQLTAGKKMSGGGGSTPQYDLVVLAPPNVNVTWSSAADVDDVGNVVGHYEDDSGEHFAYHYNRTHSSFQSLAGGTTALGLNNRGEIVGGNSDLGLALYWDDRQSVPDILGGLTASGSAVASDINDEGIAVGQSFDDSVSSAVLWIVSAQGVTGAMELLPLPGDTHALARKVSEFDQAGVAFVVGYSGDDSLGYDSGRAVMWGLWIDENGDLQTSPAIDLGALKGGISTGNGVNINGDICGTSEYHIPFVKSEGQAMQPLDMPRKAASGGAYGVDDNGTVVGQVIFQVKNGAHDERAYLWSGGKATDLNSQVALGNSEVLESATAISNQGHIVGLGFFPTTSEGTVAFLLTPR